MIGDFINFYGRRVGHLSPTIKSLIDNLLPKYSFDENNILSNDFLLNISKFKQVNLEIGFGSGDFIFQQASQNPTHLFLGVEVFLNGVGQLLQKLNNYPLDNLKIYNNNVYLILNKFNDNFFDNIYILFPDPWHKLKHNKRRIINEDNLATFYKLLKPSGKLYFFSDHLEYAKWSLEKIKNHSKFFLNKENLEDFKVCPINDFSTKYQRKALTSKRDIYHFVGQKHST